jgi:hypothetical protein
MRDPLRGRESHAVGRELLLAVVPAEAGIRTGRTLMSFSVVLRVLALICFVLAALGVPLGPVALVPLGLACWVGSTLG